MTRTARLRLLVVTALLLVVPLAVVPGAGNPAVAGTPVIDDGPWVPFTARWDGPWQAYTGATGTEKTLLGKIALRPRVFWFTSGTQKRNATDVVRMRIADFQRGNPKAYAQLALFGLYPTGEKNRTDPIPLTQQQTYRRWIDQIAVGIGSSKVIMVLEPDLAVAWGGWRPDVRFALTAYAARKLSALPNTTIYLDGSDADWLKPEKAVTMLLKAGIRYVDGIALGSTHYSSTAGNIRYGADLVKRLGALGVPGKTVVVDTADNARPFTPQEFYQRYPNGWIGNANLCRTKTETKCVTLGIPPTTDVTNARWRLSESDRALAARYVDAYLWFGRPWLYNQAAPFRLNRALAVASTTPY
ncbi:MAG: glycoside hydrolase family 6 protein [Propionibacteriales bacterium]|nr:glycoside hydrolase family 6 protein [Propionibacteriales bacterium]